MNWPLRAGAAVPRIRPKFHHAVAMVAFRAAEAGSTTRQSVPHAPTLQVLVSLHITILTWNGSGIQHDKPIFSGTQTHTPTSSSSI